MRTRIIVSTLTACMCCAPGHTTAQTIVSQAPRSAPPGDEEPTSPERPVLSPGLAGTWRSAPYEITLSGDLEKSVWGPNASSVRNVALVIRPSGEATLTVTTRVVDARKQTVRGSTAIEEAQLAVGGAQASTAFRTEHAVKVVSAERRYPDEPGYRWQIEGLRVNVTSLADRSDAIEIRFDTPEGRGSFWDTLTRRR